MNATRFSAVVQGREPVLHDLAPALALRDTEDRTEPMTTPQPLTLANALSHAAVEALRLSQIAARIDAACGSLPVPPGSLPPATLADLQSADLLRQSLECLARYLDAVSRSTDPGIALSAQPLLEAMPLRDLAEALQGRVPGGHGPARAAQETEFF